MKPRKFKYPTDPSKMKHELVCGECGAVRRSFQPPSSPNAPKVCGDCAAKHQAGIMRNFLRKKNPAVDRQRRGA